MSCFCHQPMQALQQQLQQLQETAADARPDNEPNDGPGNQAQQRRTAAVAAAASWLAARGLPAAAWQPDPTWLATRLPSPQLGRAETATLVLLGTLRKQAEDLGIDPLQPGQATKLTRLVATLNARLKPLAETASAPDPGPWQRLAAQSEAADTVQQAAKSGLLDPSPEQVEAYSQPAGRPMAQWQPLLRKVRDLAPLIASAAQLGVPLDAPDSLLSKLAEAVRRLRNLAPPPLAETAFMGRLQSLLSAIDRLRRSLGVDPVKAGYANVERAVAARTEAADRLLRQHPQPPDNLPYCPTTIAPPAVLQAAASQGVRQLADVNWKVPAATALPALQSILPATALARQMAALGLDPVRSAPCGAGCDAARIMRALG